MLLTMPLPIVVALSTSAFSSEVLRLPQCVRRAQVEPRPDDCTAAAGIVVVVAGVAVAVVEVGTYSQYYYHRYFRHPYPYYSYPIPIPVPTPIPTTTTYDPLRTSLATIRYRCD